MSVLKWYDMMMTDLNVKKKPGQSTKSFKSKISDKINTYFTNVSSIHDFHMKVSYVTYIYVLVSIQVELGK